MCEKAGKAYRDAHFEEAACARVLVNVDDQVAGWGALDTPILDVNSAAQHWCNLQASAQQLRCTDKQHTDKQHINKQHVRCTTLVLITQLLS